MHVNVLVPAVRLIVSALADSHRRFALIGGDDRMYVFQYKILPLELSYE